MPLSQALGTRPRRARWAQRGGLWLNFARVRGSGVGPPAGDTARVWERQFTRKPGELSNSSDFPWQNAAQTGEFRVVIWTPPAKKRGLNCFLKPRMCHSVSVRAALIPFSDLH